MVNLVYQLERLGLSCDSWNTTGPTGTTLVLGRASSTDVSSAGASLQGNVSQYTTGLAQRQSKPSQAAPIASRSSTMTTV